MNDSLKDSILTRIEIFKKDNGIAVGALVISKNKSLEKVHELLGLALQNGLKTIYLVNTTDEIEAALSEYSKVFTFIHANNYDHMLDLIYPNS